MKGKIGEEQGAVGGMMKRGEEMKDKKKSD